MPPIARTGRSNPDLRRASGSASKTRAASIGRAAWLWLCAAMVSLMAFGASMQPEDAGAGNPPTNPNDQPSPIRFLAFDLFIDPKGRPLAAYQVEITTADGPISTLVGVEGGDGQYAAAPYYDPAALHPSSTPPLGALQGDAEATSTPARSDRVILAAIADLDDEQAGAAPAITPPTTDSRIARLHYMVEGASAPALSARLIIAGADEHTPIDAVIRLVPVVIEDP